MSGKEFEIRLLRNFEEMDLASASCKGWVNGSWAVLSYLKTFSLLWFENMF